MTSGHASLVTSFSRGHAHHLLDWRNIYRVAFLLISHVTFGKTSSGCSDGSREGLHGFASTAACSGTWRGHVNNASSLCSSGWRVCNHHDVILLRNITWEHAQRVPGCMAINAAHDGGRCRECRDDLERDDMGGVGHDCPHQYPGMTSCISGGRIDASCCVDSHFRQACHHGNHMTGVLCCRLPVRPPHIQVRPPSRMKVYKDHMILLTCHTSGMPPPRMHWYKNGRQLTRGNSRMSMLSSGDLVVTSGQPMDSGLYTCEAINEQGVDTASSYVTVAEHPSGCRDGSTEALHKHRDIHACRGTWQGHVRRGGRSLCARGWRVCGPRDSGSVGDVTSWEALGDTEGCYGYNADSRGGGKCRRCRSSMSGIGRDCGHVSPSSNTSCLPHATIDVFPPNVTSSCQFSAGLTSGVVCCKKPKKSKNHKLTPKCNPRCQHKGICVSHNRCKCTEGYKGSRCHIPVCTSDCGPKGQCVRPNKCRCFPGYSGKTCRAKSAPCRSPCLNGGRCKRGRCQCHGQFWGKACQYPLQHMLLTRLNRTEK